MLIEIGNRFKTSLSNVLFVGDNLNDIKAAQAAGVMPVLVRTGKGNKTVTKLAEHGFNDVPVYDNLEEVVNSLLIDHV
jgi:D-glycero-D-manno-heptose 1,7-bisphosphate phosphatase